VRAARPEVAVGLLNPVGGVVAKSGVHALRRDEHFGSGLPCGDDHINLLGVVLAQEVGARAGCLVVGPAAPKTREEFGDREGARGTGGFPGRPGADQRRRPLSRFCRPPLAECPP
jgi:hypothetical protein